MAIAVAITHQYDNGQSIDVIGTFTASGSYSTGGDTVSWASTNIKSTKVPVFVQADGIGGYFYEYDLANSKLFVRQCAASATLAPQIAASTYPSGVSGDTITFRALFPKNI